MKKVVVLSGLLAVMVAFALVSCAPAKTTLKVLHYVDATSAGYAQDKAIWDKFIADNPDIVIEKEELFNDPFHAKVSSYIAAGTIPDVQYAWPSGRSSELHTKNLLADLAPVLGADYLKDFVPAAIDPNNQAGKKLAILPQSVTYTSVMYVNKGLLDSLGLAVPATYDDLKAMVPKLKAKGIATVLMANKDTWPMQSCLFSTVAGRLLGDGYINEILAGNKKFTDQEFVDALQVVANLYKDGIISKDTIQIGYGETPAMFAAGKAAFLVDGDWRIGDFLTNKDTGKALIDPAKQGSDFQFMAFPALAGEVNPGAVSAIVGVGYGASAAAVKDGAKAAAITKLLKYLYSPEVQQQRMESGAFIPSRMGVTSDKLEPFTTNMAAFYSTVPKTTYVLDGVLDASVNAPLNDGLQAIGLGTKTPAQVAKDIQDKFDAWTASK